MRAPAREMLHEPTSLSALRRALRRQRAISPRWQISARRFACKHRGPPAQTRIRLLAQAKVHQAGQQYHRVLLRARIQFQALPRAQFSDRERPPLNRPHARTKDLRQPRRRQLPQQSAIASHGGSGASDARFPPLLEVARFQTPPPLTLSSSRATIAAMNQQRQRIDEIAAQIAALLQARATLAQENGALKAEKGKPAYDPAREAEVLRSVSAAAGPLSPRQVRSLFTEIISACRALEQPLRVTFMGPQHTFSHVAALQAFGSQAQYEPVTTITEVFRRVEAEQAEIGVVPVENSTGGVVPETLDCLLESELKICAELHVPVHVAVLSTTSLPEVRT